jgi:transposase InsO family protein
MALFRQRVVKHALKVGNISSSARLFRVSRQSVHRWIGRWDGTLESLMDHSHRPHRHPSQHTQEEVNTVLKVQRHNKRLGVVCLWVHLKMNFGYSRTLSALYKLLRREGVLDAPKKAKRRKNKPYEPILMPGERFQMDVKHVPKDCMTGSLCGKKLYQYTAIDECTRWRHIAVFDELSTHNSVEFLYQVMERFPFEISCIQTDNGSEFTSRYQGSTHPSAFEAELAAFGIRHKLIAPATPRHNGKVERSHRSDQERFYNDRKFYNQKYLKEQMSRYLRISNRQPLSAHGWRTAQEMLEAYQYVL